MAKVAPSYTPGWKHSLEIDGEEVESMGLVVTPGGTLGDVMTNKDNGFEKDEVQSRNVQLAFSIPLKAAQILEPPVEYGDIVPMKASHNGKLKYDGPFLITGAVVNATNKAVSTLDVTAKNYGDVTPDPEGQAALPNVVPAEDGAVITEDTTTEATPTPGL